MQRTQIVLGAMALVCAAAATTAAADNKEMCVPPSFGLPGSDAALGAFYGPPQWVRPWNGDVPTRVLDTRTEDPRWVNAGGSSIADTFAGGSALNPVETRFLTSDVEGAQYLYASWTINIGDTAGYRLARIAFQPGPGQKPKLLRIRLPALPRPGPEPIPVCTSSDTSCAAVNPAFYQMMTDANSDGIFDYCTGAAPIDDPCHADNVAPPWLTESLRVWKPASGQWVIAMRIPVAPATATRFAQGIVPTPAVVGPPAVPATPGFAFDVVVQVAGTFAFYSWPRTFAIATSPNNSTAITLPAVTAWGTVHSRDSLLFSAPSSNNCQSIRVATNSGLGVVQVPTTTSASALIGTTLTTQIKGTTGAPAYTPLNNEFVVKLENNSLKNIAVGEVKATFRIANWGTQIGDVRGDLSSAWNPVPAGAVGPGGLNVGNDAVINAGTTGVAHFSWELNRDQRCAYGLATPSDGTGPTACTQSFYRHQCIMVDLTGTSTLDVDFETRGTWNNFDFYDLSTVGEVATIDVRGLPIPQVAPGVEVYLVGMARNMPTDERTTGTTLVRNAVFARYERDLKLLRNRDDNLPVPENLEPVNENVSGRFGDPDRWGNLPDPRLPNIARFLPERQYRELRAASVLMQMQSEGDSHPAGAEEALYSEVGAATAAELLPTLDIYALYRDPTTDRLVSMTGFTYFLSHPGTLNGLSWVIDGATQMSPNVYRLVVPRESTQPVRVRVQAREDGDMPLRPITQWPCGCVCNRSCPMTPTQAMGTSLPMAGALLVLGGRRRRRRSKS